MGSRLHTTQVTKCQKKKQNQSEKLKHKKQTKKNVFSIHGNTCGESEFCCCLFFLFCIILIY